MNRVAKVLIGVIGGALFSSSVLAQQTAGRNPLVGAWKIVEIQNKAVSQPSLYLFTGRHYSRMIILGEKPQATFKDSDQAKPTAQEKIAAYDTLVAATGTYEISGNTIVLNVLIAKSPSRSPVKLQFSVEGNTLTLTNPEAKLITKLTRIE